MIRSNIIIVISLCFILALPACKTDAEKKDKTEQTNDTIAQSKIEQLNKKIENQPDNADLYHQRAQYYLNREQLNKSFRDINEALERDGNNPDYLLTLSDIYFSMDQFTKTEQTLNNILIEHPDNIDALIKMAKLFLYKDEHRKAFGFLNRALEVDPEDHRVFFISGLTYKDHGELSKAKRDFHRTVEAKQDFYPAWIQLGLLAAENNDSNAVYYYRNALDIRPESTEALYNLGYYYQEQEQYDKAIQTYNQLLDIDPEFEHAYYNIGYIYLTGTGEYEKAEQYFRQARDINPSNVNAVFNLGSALEQQGKYEEARKMYKQTLQMQDNYKLGIEGLNRLDEKQQ
ncbi:MAG: tetratricopeptide repeat protein [Bacteroidales bacterium]